MHGSMLFVYSLPLPFGFTVVNVHGMTYERAILPIFPLASLDSSIGDRYHDVRPLARTLKRFGFVTLTEETEALPTNCLAPGHIKAWHDKHVSFI